MDNNSTNDTDKRNWRERLGVGSKVMPRISEEFTKPVEPTLATPRAGQPVSVAKPAPMAPRVAVKPAPQVARPQQQMPPQNAKPMQPSSPQSPEVLAEKLRSQRAAAEKLAEQRVLAARDRAENGRPTSAPSSPIKSMTPSTGAKPKFSFADNDPRAVPTGRPPQRPIQQQSPLQPQLSPPRPSLGGQSRQAPPPPGYQPTFRPQPPQGYRPIDPATGYTPPPQRGYENSAADPRLQQPRMGAEPYRRNGAQDDLGYPASNYEPVQRAIPRQDALRAQPRSADDDYSDDIFEEAPPPQRTTRRASATDYNQAYRDSDDGYGEERRRSSGPWLLLLFLMLAAAAAGAGVWYYQTKVKTVGTPTASQTTPVVAAPDVAAKVAPEQPVDTQQATPGLTPSKKQIYDRIIGDKEILGGQVTPTEEVPVQPDATQGAAQQIPQPATDGTAGTGSGEALPLPMPPPPGSDTQGALPKPAGSDSIAVTDPALKKVTNEVASATDTPIAPVPGETAGAATTTQATPPSDTVPAKEEITNEAPVVAKKIAPKTVEAPAKVKAKTKVAKTVALGAAPVVLVPPSDDVAIAENVDSPIVSDQPVVAQPAPAKKKKTLFGLFNGTNEQVDTVEAAPVVQQQKQVAALPDPEPQPVVKNVAPAQPATTGTGYYVQLASFKSQGEATAEYGRLKSKHASILSGMSPVVNPATVGGSTRYRLAIGPLSSRDQASNVCNSLVSAGERDCIVRKQ